MTLLKIALAVLLVVVVIKLWPVVLMVIVAVLIAVMLDPLPVMLERRGVRRSITVLALALVIFGLFVTFFVMVVPSISAQIAELNKDWPQVEQRLGAVLLTRAQTYGKARGSLMGDPGQSGGVGLPPRLE